MKITDSAALGEAIRKRRKELHYTQSDLAFFWSFENGRPKIGIFVSHFE